MILLELKTEIFRRRERIRVHLEQFHHGYSDCQNKISHNRFDRDMKFLELLWQANSVEEIPPELLLDCKPSFWNDLKQYFRFPLQSRHNLCEVLKVQFHREHGLKVENTKFKQALQELEKIGVDRETAHLLHSNCTLKQAEMAWFWAKESLPLYSKYSATNPVEASEYLRKFFFSNRNEQPENINKWLASYKLAPIDSVEVDDFRKVCIGIRHSLNGLKNQLTSMV